MSDRSAGQAFGVKGLVGWLHPPPRAYPALDSRLRGNDDVWWSIGPEEFRLGCLLLIWVDASRMRLRCSRSRRSIVLD